MTPNFVDDRLAVEALLDSPAPYVGLMGPPRAGEEMLAEVEAEGRGFTEDDLASQYTPGGLDLGGAPYQIARGIVAEALAVHNDRTPGHLRTREGPVHDRVDVDADDAPAR